MNLVLIEISIILDYININIILLTMLLVCFSGLFRRVLMYLLKSFSYSNQILAILANKINVSNRYNWSLKEVMC